MSVRLTNLDIHILSLVDKAANKRQLIIKNLNLPESSIELDKVCQIRKVDDEKRMVYSVVYPANEIDAHGEFATASDVEKACHNFMRKSKTGNVDTQHNLVTDQDCFVAENWIIRKGDELFPEETDLDGWASGIKVENDEIWQKIKKGEITGVSMWGFAEKVEEDEDGNVAKFMKHIKKFFHEDDEITVVSKDFSERLKRYEMRNVVEAVTSEYFSVINNDMQSLDERKQTLIDVSAEFVTKLSEIEVAKSLIEKEGRTLSGKNLKAIQTALTNLKQLLDAADKNKEQVEKLKKSIVENAQPNSGTPESGAGSPAPETTPVAKSTDERIADLEALAKKQAEIIEKLSGESNGSQQDPESPEQTPVAKSTISWLRND